MFGIKVNLLDMNTKLFYIGIKSFNHGNQFDNVVS